MFADTLTFTVNGNAKVLNRIRFDQYSSEYLLRETTGEYRVKIRNSSIVDKTRGGIRVDRHSVTFTQLLNPVAPATYGQKRTAFESFEHDFNDTVVDPVKHAAAMNVFLSEANLTKMANWEA